MKKSGSKILVFLIILIAFVSGYLLKGRSAHLNESPSEIPAGESGTKILFWTCSMHPQIHQPNPGQCPICAMDLIPVTDETPEQEDGAGPNLTLSPAAQKLAQIQVTPAERKFVTAEVRMVGKIDYDETRLAVITAWVPGRIDRLYVDFTGTRVQKGDHLVYLYSPELLTAQKELLETLKGVENLGKSNIESIRQSTRDMVESSREKLRLLGLTAEQIKNIETSEKPSDHLTIYSPIGGIVIHKNATEGMYVNTGTPIYTISDLTHLWVRLDAYETDLAFLRYGQEAEFETEAYPGEIFKGKIAFIDPVLNEKTRTVKVRVNLSNPEGKLKPGLFVRGMVRATLSEGNKVLAPDLAGKWISPMHPEIVKDEPGNCDICGMPLVRAETLGFVSEGNKDAKPSLVIPSTAPLITGKRALVYIQKPGLEGTFEAREIVLGHRAGDYYIVQSGLDEGEKVVVNGNFKIDSAIQILGKPSMMSPEGGSAAIPHHQTSPSTEDRISHETMPPQMKEESFETPEQFKTRMDSLFLAYFDIQKALTLDNLEEARKAFDSFSQNLGNVDMGLLKGEAHNAWMKELNVLEKNVINMKKAESIEEFRLHFASLSDSLTIAAKKFGLKAGQTIFRLHCPMAFNNRGADWLQSSGDQVENPYFGAAMLRCGEKVETISGFLKDENKK